VVTGLLGRYFKEAGLRVVTQKWIQSGCKDFSGSDVRTHLRIMKCSLEQMSQYSGLMLPYILKFPSSPHLAARVEKKKVRAAKILKSYKCLAKDSDMVVVEGIGGVLVPYDKNNLVIGLAKKLDLAVLVVAQNKLGAINHTLLTVEALRKRKMKVLGIIFNSAAKEDKLISQDNPVIISALSRQKALGVLPWKKNYDMLYKKFIPIGQRIEKCL
jgi:dethiobiotin synthetase